MMTDKSRKACPFVDRLCVAEGCIAWGSEDKDCKLIVSRIASLSPFEQKLRNAAPLMYRSLLDLTKILEETSKDCTKCGPELWNYAQELRANLLEDLIKAELAEAGIRAEKDSGRRC